MGEYQLAREIVALSEADNWPEARREWLLATVYFADEPDRCLCGKFPIIELCVLSNRRNGNEAVVGNECVKKFLGLPSDLIFTAIKRIRQDADAALNSEAIRYARRRGWINNWEQSFYLDTWRKRSLSESQKRIRRQINEKVLRHVAQDRRPRQGAL